MTSQLTALTEIARRRGVDTLLLREPANLAWLLGCRYQVPNTLDSACFDVIVGGLDGDSPSVSVVCNNIEAPRLADVEFPPSTKIDEHLVVPWWGERSTHFPTGPGVGADRRWPEARSVASDLAAARRILNEQQAAQLETVCTDAAAATGRVARTLRPGLTEFEVAGRLSAELLTAELEPVVLMVAADGRDRVHRHPLPTGRIGEQSFLLVCCARRHGLIASVTRNVYVNCAGIDRAERRERQAALLAVEQVFLDNSVPGATLGDIVTAGTDAYPRNGFDADEWTRHHQGGLSGWLPREFPAHRTSEEALAAGTVVAWNPSGDGCKVEDTCLVTADGPRPLVHDPNWPSVTVGGRTRPDLLWL
jgi:Xaa-Pro aminopeptidase